MVHANACSIVVCSACIQCVCSMMHAGMWYAVHANGACSMMVHAGIWNTVHTNGACIMALWQYGACRYVVFSACKWCTQYGACRYMECSACMKFMQYGACQYAWIS